MSELEFKRFCDKLKSWTVKFGATSDQQFQIQDREETNLHDANAVSSELKSFPQRHLIVLDIDFPCLLVESSTPGHHHLIIDSPPMSWDQYEKVLDALADARIISYGYAGASKHRKATFIRTPWAKKEK